MSSSQDRKQVDERSPLLPRTDQTGEPVKKPTELSRARFWTLLGCLYLVISLSALDASIVANLAPSISAEFGRPDLFSTLGTSYLVASCSIMPVFARLSDIYGRCRVLCAAGTLFMFGNLGCALARNMTEMIAARFVGGLGFAGFVPVTGIIINDLISQRDRAVYTGQCSVKAR